LIIEEIFLLSNLYQKKLCQSDYHLYFLSYKISFSFVPLL